MFVSTPLPLIGLTFSFGRIFTLLGSGSGDRSILSDRDAVTVTWSPPFPELIVGFTALLVAYVNNIVGGVLSIIRSVLPLILSTSSGLPAISVPSIIIVAGPSYCDSGGLVLLLPGTSRSYVKI